jgi:small-conductance mechanosensitive channel
MAWRDTIENWTARLQPFRPLLFPIAIAIVLIAFAPARIAATLLGVLAGIGLSNGFIPRVRPAVQSATLWVMITVTADAAYARLNDQAPLTLVNAFSKVVDAIMKLVFPIIRGLGLSITDPRYKVAAVAPDFIWALILSLAALMSLTFVFPSQRNRRDYEPRVNDRGGMSATSRPRAVA